MGGHGPGMGDHGLGVGSTATVVSLNGQVLKVPSKYLYAHPQTWGSSQPVSQNLLSAVDSSQYRDALLVKGLRLQDRALVPKWMEPHHH